MMIMHILTNYTNIPDRSYSCTKGTKYYKYTQ